MSKLDIGEALYALPDIEIIQRRKPLTLPITLTMVGFALFAINICVESSVETSNLKSALVLTAVALLLIGGIITLIRISGNDDVPYHAGDGCYLKREELRFEKDKKNYIVTLIENADFSTLRSLKQDGVSAITVTLYSSPKSDFCACQAFEYAELQRRPVSEVKYKK